jgi:hypothetical protein
VVVVFFSLLFGADPHSFCISDDTKGRLRLGASDNRCYDGDQRVKDKVKAQKTAKTTLFDIVERSFVFLRVPECLEKSKRKNKERRINCGWVDVLAPPPPLQIEVETRKSR